MAIIIDFNDLKNKAPRVRESGPIPGADTAQAFFSDLNNLFAALPQDEIMHQTYHAMEDRIARLLLLTAVASKAGQTLNAQGFPADRFELDDASVDAFMVADIESATLPKLNDPVPTELLWNGPRFDYTADNGTVTRLATTVLQNESRTVCTMDILRMRIEDDEWSLWNNGDWVPGPPDGFFEERDQERMGMLPGWDGDEALEDDNVGIDPWNSNSLMILPLSPSIRMKLLAAGIETAADLMDMTAKDVLKIPGIGVTSLGLIETALQMVGLGLKK